jgi:hypothetical protein
MEHEGQSLDSLLNDEPVSEPVEAPVVEVAPETPETPEPASDGPARGADGKFIPKQTTGVEETVPPTDKLPQEDYKAIREEREKRQALQAELDALKQQFEAAKEPPAPPPSMWEDEQGWQQHFGGEVVSTAVQQATFQARLDMSEMLVRQANPDFDEIKERFVQMMQANPALQQQALSDPHPWSRAYDIAKNAKAIEEIGATNLDELREKIRAELMAETQAQMPVPQQTLPPTLTTERNVGSRTGPAWAGPKPLAELLG